MVSTTDTQTGTDSGVINGIPVGLTAELPTFATETFDVSATITTGGDAQDINIALIIDTSGSTSNNSGSDVDGDGDTDTFLEAQQLAAKAVMQNLIDAGYNLDNVSISVVEYNTNENFVGTFALSEQAAFDAAIDGLTAGGRTDFDDGLDGIIDAWRADPTIGVDDVNRVLFLSDGRQNEGNTDYAPELAILQNEFNAPVTAIGVGTNADVGDPNDPDDSDLDEIGASTGGAILVTDLADLPALLNTPPPLPELQEVQIIVNGSVVETIPAGDPRIIETAAGLRIDCEEISSLDGDYTYVVGDTLEVAVKAIFTPNGDELLVDGFLLPMFVCFVRGTRVLTPTGLKAVEDIEVGDRIVTRDHGTQPVRWIGSTKLPQAALEARPELRPIRLKAGSMGDNLPERDLCVSRQHRILVRGWQAELLFGTAEGVLTPAFTLINDSTIVTDHGSQNVEYFHMAFDNHEVVYAEGVEAESFHPYRDTVSILDEAQREELFKLFPQLEHGAAFPAARTELKGRDGLALAPKDA